MAGLHPGSATACYSITVELHAKRILKLVNHQVGKMRKLWTLWNKLKYDIIKKYGFVLPPLLAPAICASEYFGSLWFWFDHHPISLVAWIQNIAYYTIRNSFILLPFNRNLKFSAARKKVKLWDRSQEQK